MGGNALNNVAIVATSYLLLWAADAYIEYVPLYYLACMLIHLIIMALCMSASGELIKYYGAINVVPLLLYYPYVFDYYEFVEYLMWDSALNVSNIVLSFELLIITKSGIDALISVYCWACNDRGRCSFSGGVNSWI